MQKVKFNRPATRFSCLSSLWVVFFMLLAVAQAAHGQAVKIMPLGDSLTSGHRSYVSYRYDLWFDLIDAGFDVDFVGNLKNTYHDPNLDWYPEYLATFDRDHSGYWGYQTHEIVGQAKSVSASLQPDIVLLLAGVNDIWIQGNVGVTNARFGLRDIIEGIQARVPGVTILLGLMNPYQGQNSELIGPLNDIIATVASDLDTTESPVILVDHYTGFNIGSMTHDGLHHNRVGEAWVAENWFEVLASIWPASEPFQINAGHSGAWFNPDTSGQGQLIDVEPETQFMFVSWFTYTDAASDHPFEQRWLTAQGNYSGNTAELDLWETLGGKFDDLQEVTRTRIGEVTLSFNDCKQGLMSYNIDEEELLGEFPLNRVIGGSGNVCEGLSGNATQAVDINAGMDGAWFDSDTPGQGFFIDAHPDPEGSNFIFVSWFTYGEQTASGQRWLTAQGGFEGSTAEIDVWETTGGSFDDPQPVSRTKVGTMSLDFTDCSNAQLTYSLPADASAGDIAITRVIPGGRALCEELAGAE